MAEQNHPNIERNFNNPSFREVHKNTWLKLISHTSSKRKKEKLWVVFCIHDDTNPFLETYLDSKLALYHKPEKFISLKNIQHISPTICPQEQEYEFVITLSSEVIRLAAPTWEQMLDWVESLRAKLHELKLLNPKENLYSKLPEKSISLLPTRDPTSPLPPPPLEVPPETVLGVEQVNISERRIQPQSATSQENGNPSEEMAARDTNVFNFDNINDALLSETPTGSAMASSTHYEMLFEAQQSPGTSVRSVEPTTVERSVNSVPRILLPPAQPYRTLREQQVLQLQREIEHPGGVRIQLRKKDCISSIALVDAFNTVWVCGWKQKEHPMLYNALHIGDCLVNIEGINVKTSTEAHKILQSQYCGLYVNIVIRRIPFGQVFVIHRESEGQPLGLVLENNTAVIEMVESDGLAARHGLTARTKTCDGTSFTNWVLTEINGRPLNLFFKKNQVSDRLNAVGKDISILVQPLDLIKQLKKHMKNLKNYKDYILQ